ncbi:hypothetical protein NSS79_20500 [Paenibacillus sp. FSL L8-0436]|uniref:hypothetical protein n=1 Tax=Paenibacillus sp. FSL L8-0436 TaxID=2954686 RepID=UPI003157FB4C
MKIGTKIYYEKATGNVILNTGERAGAVVETTREQDFASYKVLSERVEETVGLIELEYGQYATEFLESRGRIRVNPETEKLEFNYGPIDPEEPTEPVYQKPLTERIALAETETAGMALELAQTQARLDQAEKDSASLLLSLVEGGVI